MIKKERKTLYLPDWIIAYLDTEGQIYDGPGVVAAAAIYDFYRKPDQGKKEALKAYTDCAIELSYSADEPLDKLAARRAARKVLPGSIAEAEKASRRRGKAGTQKGSG